MTEQQERRLLFVTSFVILMHKNTLVLIMSIYNMNGNYNILEKIKTKHTKSIYFQKILNKQNSSMWYPKKVGQIIATFIAILEII